MRDATGAAVAGPDTPRGATVAFLRAARAGDWTGAAAFYLVTGESVAGEGTLGRRSDGTELGTVRVKDIDPGISGSIPFSLTGMAVDQFRAYCPEVIDSFQAIDQVYLMTRGGPGNATNLFIFYIYQNAFRFFDFGYASAIATVLLVLLLVYAFLLILLRHALMKRQ